MLPDKVPAAARRLTHRDARRDNRVSDNNGRQQLDFNSRHEAPILIRALHYLPTVRFWLHRAAARWSLDRPNLS
jgi:hypothetical protein